jgi:hypothetical protein
MSLMVASGLEWQRLDVPSEELEETAETLRSAGIGIAYVRRDGGNVLLRLSPEIAKTLHPRKGERYAVMFERPSSS